MGGFVIRENHELRAHIRLRLTAHSLSEALSYELTRSDFNASDDLTNLDATTPRPNDSTTLG